MRYWIISAVVAAIAIGGGAYWYVKTSGVPAFEAVAAGRGTVVASLDEPGTAAAERAVNLSFEQPGMITSLNVHNGDVVAAGQVLASLDTSALNSAVMQAHAALAGAQARLDSLISGTRPEQLAINESAVANSRASLQAALGSAYVAADDAIHNQTDNFFTNPNASNPIFTVPVSDSQRVIDIQNQRVAIGSALLSWYSETNLSTSTVEDLARIVDTTMRQISSYLNTIAIAVNGALPAAGISPTTLAGFKANVATARSEVNASVAALASAESALRTAEDQLALAQAGATAQDIEAQKAAVLQAQAAESSARVALQHAELIAPFGGNIDNLTAKIGQVVSPGVPVLSLINNSGLKMEAFVSEADVAKIKKGGDALVTLDALGTGKTFPATITEIASAETQVNNAPAYGIELHFKNPTSEIKDGMTGNVHIILGEHDDVVEVPSRLVINQGSDNFVLVKNGSGTEKRKVETGLSGGGMTEIVSGVNPGDMIVNF